MYAVSCYALNTTHLDMRWTLDLVDFNLKFKGPKKLSLITDVTY